VKSFKFLRKWPMIVLTLMGCERKAASLRLRSGQALDCVGSLVNTNGPNFARNDRIWELLIGTAEAVP
jgi:hypothetical protein